LAKLVSAASTLLKKAGKLAREIIVSWTNFGKERPHDEGAEAVVEEERLEAEGQNPLDFNPREFIFPNDEPFEGLCPKCGEKRMLTRWVKLATSRYARPCCEACASSLKIPESVVSMEREPEEGKMLSPEAAASLKLHKLWLRGRCFEDRVLALFEQSDFDVVERSDKEWAYNGSPTPLDVKDSRPDLLIKHKRSGMEFGVIIRFFRKLAPIDHRGHVIILEEYAKKKAKEYCRKFKVPCFVVVGEGLSPSKVERMFLIPLNDVNSEGMQQQELGKYDRDPRQPITFMQLADCCPALGVLSAAQSE
jgi:hypothetical protein